MRYLKVLLILHGCVFVFMLSISALQILFLDDYFEMFINFCDYEGKLLKVTMNFFLLSMIPNIILLAMYWRSEEEKEGFLILFFILASLINSVLFFYFSRIINTWYISERRVEVVYVDGKRKNNIPRRPDEYYLLVSSTEFYPCSKIRVKAEIYRKIKEGDKLRMELGRGIFGVWFVYTTTPSL